ncbi:CoA synthetase [Prauserella sp. PE36]|uniref:CoA synthetase n=2 Tax=Pseudonocardiaceae TaxID=2070 RepID=A0ABY2S5H4_9PSEU|nr:CoA synthetase [Prauserella coralliicola]RBM18388.1 CoA synthetase [Prauserella sp. PE36]TKG70648.1 CoA synthetase [Prauserella endophytica]
MAVLLARQLRNGEIGMMGASSEIPVAAALLAQCLHAPDLTVIMPSGAVNPRPGRLYRSSSDGRWFTGCEAIGTAYDLFELSENGRLDFMCYGGVQLDRFGNINLTRTGPFGEPPRFRGPGLANISMAVTAKRTLLFSTAHSPRTFVERVDYVTAPGHLSGGTQRRRAGIATAGPQVCITPLAVFGFPEPEHAMTVSSLNPGIEPGRVLDATGFALPPPPWPATEPPTGEELGALRAVVDRTGVLRS